MPNAKKSVFDVFLLVLCWKAQGVHLAARDYSRNARRRAPRAAHVQHVIASGSNAMGLVLRGPIG
jgi:hypothetical protein